MARRADVLIAVLVLVAAGSAAGRIARVDPRDENRRLPQSNLLNRDRKEAQIINFIDTKNPDGSYTYGFEADDGSYKVETRAANGEVWGKYGYIDPSGILREATYGVSVPDQFDGDAIEDLADNGIVSENQPQNNPRREQPQISKRPRIIAVEQSPVSSQSLDSAPAAVRPKPRFVARQQVSDAKQPAAAVASQPPTRRRRPDKIRHEAVTTKIREDKTLDVRGSVFSNEIESHQQTQKQTKSQIPPRDFFVKFVNGRKALIRKKLRKFGKSIANRMEELESKRQTNMQGNVIPKEMKEMKELIEKFLHFPVRNSIESSLEDRQNEGSEEEQFRQEDLDELNRSVQLINKFIKETTATTPRSQFLSEDYINDEYNVIDIDEYDQKGQGADTPTSGNAGGQPDYDYYDGHLFDYDAASGVGSFSSERTRPLEKLFSFTRPSLETSTQKIQFRSQEEIRPRFRNEFNSKKINSNKKINIKKQDGFVTKTPQNQQQQQVHLEEPQFGRPNQDQQQKIELLQQLQEERFRQQQRLQKDAPNQQLAQSHQNAFQRQQLQQVNVQQQQPRQQQPGGLFDQLRRIIESQLVQRDNPRKRSDITSQALNGIHIDSSVKQTRRTTPAVPTTPQTPTRSVDPVGGTNLPFTHNQVRHRTPPTTLRPPSPAVTPAASRATTTATTFPGFAPWFNLRDGTYSFTTTL